MLYEDWAREMDAWAEKDVSVGNMMTPSRT
jgi:hypothetical protein